MKSSIFFLSVCGVLILLASSPHASAESFNATDLADESLQTRSFTHEDPQRLLQSALQVIQDLKFQVTETDLESGLIVASLPRCRFSCEEQAFTVNLSRSTLEPEILRARISLEATDNSSTGRVYSHDYNNFYQSFYAHLSRELSLQRNMR